MTRDPSHARVLGESLRRPGYRRLALLAGFAYLLLYLYALGQLIIDPSVVPPGGSPGFVLLPEWSARLFKPIAGYTFEAVAALYLPGGLALLFALPNLLIGAALGGLVALNVATAAYALAAVRSCRRLSWTGLLGSLPGLLTGFACCVPTVALVLGANLVLALISLQGVLLSASAVALVAGLAWNLHRARRELLQAGA